MVWVELNWAGLGLNCIGLDRDVCLVDFLGWAEISD